ncbi:BspA family leucine-rich repeat surface protein [Bifidobacterium sp. ESL0682]|uniref:BspA family leucine-rich repeat surface protein n=1 Tax=Bifidobacterium sp. ESL0682 TaxID=2983212 RepID=UPI0023F62E9D|nr:BspA family leucine-rich repeat surface protein [Bifidobacterium sp. ESL0682]WEV42101.1 BspA family leucine-rich repeat surface protein [Bifidobacterium sp. ESL0682]
MRSPDFSGWTVGTNYPYSNGVVDFSEMFEYCYGLYQPTISGWHAASNVHGGNYAKMFRNDSNLDHDDVLTRGSGVWINAARSMYEGCTSLTFLDLSGYPDFTPYTMTGMLPPGLLHLKLGANTRFNTDTFSNVPAAQTWETYTTNSGRCSTITNIGNTAALANRAYSSLAQGDYYASGSLLAPSCVRVSYVYPNGGSGGGNPGIEADTTNGSASFYMPYASSWITANPSGKLFSNWNTNSNGTGTTYSSGGYASFSQHTDATIYLYAQWYSASTPAGTATAEWDRTNHWVRMVYTDTSFGDGTRFYLRGKPYASGAWSYNNGTGSSHVWRQAISDSGWTSPGNQWTIQAAAQIYDSTTGRYTTTDYYQVGTGILLYMNVSFAAGGVSGSVPGTVSALVDTGSATAQLNLPKPSNLVNPDRKVFAGWASGSQTRQVGQATIPTSEGTTSAGRTTLTLTATWATLTGPTVAAPNAHAAAGATPSVDVAVTMPAHQAGDTLNVSSAFGSGWSVSQPYATAGNADTLTWSLTPAQLRSGWDGQYKLSTSMSRVDPATGRTVASDPDVRQAVLPYIRVGFDRNDATTGTAPAGKQALVDTPTGKAWFTLPDGSGMGLAGKVFGNWATAADGTGSTFPSGAQGIPTTAGTTANGKTTVTLYAIWIDLPAPTGVSATWKHATNRVSFAVSGLPAGATSWQIRYKPGSGQSWWTEPGDTMTPAGTYDAYGPYFTTGDTWAVQLRATATDSTGAATDSAWSDDIRGVLPYMTVTLKPGQGTGDDTSAAGLVDAADGKAYLSLPAGTGTAPDGMAFQTTGGWTTNPDGTGQAYDAGDTAIPTASGLPGRDQETVLTLYAQWRMRTQPPARGTPCTSVTGWQQWGTSAGARPGVANQDTGAVCWTIEGTTLRLTGGTSPDYGADGSIPWGGYGIVNNVITKVSIEGDLTLTKTSQYSLNSPFTYQTALTQVDAHGHNITLDRNAGHSLFNMDQALRNLDLNGWRTGTATDMGSMFSYCDHLDKLDGLSGWDMRNVTGMTDMFYNTSSLTDIDLSGWTIGQGAEMSEMFLYSGVKDLDLSGWDTSRAATAYSMSRMLPRGLQRLRLGERTRLAPQAFDSLDTRYSWHEWDWPKGHRPTDLGPVGPTQGSSGNTPGNGTLGVLETRANSATPQGVYIRDDVTPTWTDLTYNLQGGTGDTSLPTQVGAAASGSTPRRDGLAIDTTFRPGSYTVPDTAASHITANKAHGLFQGWSYDTGGVTGGTATVSNHTLTASKGAGGQVTIDATWQALAGEASGTVDKVSVTANTSDQGTATVKVSATLPAGDTSFKACVKPSSQSGSYAADQCQSMVSTASGWQSAILPVFTLPGSLTAGQSTTFPGPGLAYTMAAVYTVKDPVTNNSVDSEATAAGGGLTTGTLAWLRLPFDVNTANGGSGVAPGGTNAHDGHADAIIDTGSGNAWPLIPGPDGMHGYASGSPAADHGVFQGWAITRTSARPNSCTPGSHCSLGTSLPITPGEHDWIPYYAVWREVKTPTVTGVKRDPTTNQVTVTGTATPLTANDGLDVCVGAAGCANVAIDATDGHGTTLAYDGSTSHTWTRVINAGDLAGGDTTVTATLGSTDTYRTGTPQVYSIPANGTWRIAGFYQHQMPLTGGRRQWALLAALGLALAVVAAAGIANNRRQQKHHA